MVFGGTYSSCLYLLFLSWYKKRRQKKIKASAEAGETGRVHDGNRKRDTFCGNTVGAYCIRPQNVPSMDLITWKRDAFLSFIEYEHQKRDAFSDYMIVITWKIDAFCAFAILGMSFGRAYAIRPYIGSQKIDTFSGNTVGAYCIRPTNVPSMERII